MANFPTSLDNSTSLPYPSAGNFTNSPSLASGQDGQNDALIAIETKIGTGSSTPTNNTFLTGNGTGTSVWGNTVPAGTVVGTTDTQTLTNKALTSPAITGGTIDNATVTIDAVSGHTSANTGTVYGVSVSAGVIASAALNNSVNTAAIQAAAVTATKMQYGMVRERQGGTTGDATWYTKGTSNTDTSAKAAFFQVGSVGLSTSGTDVTVTFPVAFTQVPVVFCTTVTAASTNVPSTINTITTTTFKIRAITADGSTETAVWLAIGQ